MHRWSIATGLLLALSGTSCSGGGSTDPLAARECTDLRQIATAAINVFELGTSVEDQGSAYYLQDHARAHEASLDDYAERVPDALREDIETLHTVYADYAGSIEAQGLTSGKTPSPSQADSINAAATIDESEVEAAAQRVLTWVRKSCGDG